MNDHVAPGAHRKTWYRALVHRLGKAFLRSVTDFQGRHSLIPATPVLANETFDWLPRLAAGTEPVKLHRVRSREQRTTAQDGHRGRDGRQTHKHADHGRTSISVEGGRPMKSRGLARTSSISPCRESVASSRP